jgi:hypothetical protein
LQRIHHALYEQCREQARREASPTAAIIDSQSLALWASSLREVKKRMRPLFVTCSPEFPPADS